MKIAKNLIAGAVAAAVVSTPVFAQAERASAPAGQTEEGFGEGGLSFVPLIGIVATLVGIIVLASKDDAPVSP